MPEIDKAFIDNGVLLFTKDGAALDQDSLTATLKKYKIKVTGMKKSTELPF